MGLPGQRRSRSHKMRRAAHFALKHRTFAVCSNCKKNIRPHTMCPFCGMYRGRKIMATKVEKSLMKKARRAKLEKGETKE